MSFRNQTGSVFIRTTCIFYLTEPGGGDADQTEPVGATADADAADLGMHDFSEESDSSASTDESESDVDPAREEELEDILATGKKIYAWSFALVHFLDYF